jgi:hypothetical protein
MKKLMGVLMIAAMVFMVACTGKVEKEVKITKNDSVVEKDITVKFGCMHGAGDTCAMKCCDNKRCDSLCAELSKIICQIVDLKVKRALCCMHECMKEGKCDTTKCDPKKCDPKKCDPKCRMHGKN